MDYIREAIEALKGYNTLIAAEKNISEQIKALILERDNIKAQKLSHTSGGASEHDDKLVNNIFIRKILHKNLILTRKKIECMDRAFATLTHEEGQVLNRIFVLEGKNSIEDLKEQLGYERTKVYEIKNVAIRKFAKAMFGIGAA